MNEELQTGKKPLQRSQVGKIIVGVKTVQQKKSTGFCNGKFSAFLVLFCGITSKWVLFPTIDLYIYQLTQIVRKYIIYSFLREQSRLRYKLKVYMFELAKNGPLFRLVRFSLHFLFACSAINRVNLAFRTTITEDTHLTLAVILFKIEANNSLIFLLLQTYEKQCCQVSIPFHCLLFLSHSL